MGVNNIEIIGDLHLGRLSYSEYIKDNRIKEKEAVLGFIVQQSTLSDTIVLLGDNFNTKTPSAETVKEFTNFIERFEDKRVIILGGNHEVCSNGRSSLDYLKEIKNKNWKIVTNEVYQENGIVFCPFFSTSSLGVNTNKEAVDKIMSMLPDGDILFTHLAITGCKTISGTLTDDFVEPVLPKEIISKKYKQVFAGHIHKSAIYDNITLTGSIFTNEVGEKEKYIWQYSRETGLCEKMPLPVRRIIKLENPSNDDIAKLKDDDIVKVIITKERTGTEIMDLRETLKKKLKESGAYLLVERVEKKRVRAHYGAGESITDMPLERLLEVYAEQKNIDILKLKLGLELIQDEHNQRENSASGQEIHG